MIKTNCSYDKMVTIGDLKPNPRNPNKHPDKQIELLAKIIKAQGWKAPITVSNQSGFIVRGHGRYMAAQLLKAKKVPVDYQDYDNDAQEWADLVADNKIAEFANLDADITAQLIREIEATDLDVDLELTGFTQSQIQKMLMADLGKPQEKPEVEFTEELHESQNYIVLYFDNDIDWLQALTLFELKTVKALDSKPGYQKQGIGRVINGAEAINKILKL